MGAIINASINVAALPKEKFVIGKDEREAKIQRLSLGNAKVVWIKDAEGNSGKIFLAEREEDQLKLETAKSDLPF